MKERIKELESLINHYDKQYWENGIEEISDDEYESLKTELKGLDPTNSRLTRVNTVKVNSRGKINHPEPMLSLDKLYDSTKLLDWMHKVARSQNEQFIMSPKWDGMAMQQYPNHILATRGKGGLEGEDISDRILLIEIWDAIIDKDRAVFNKDLNFPCHRFLGKQTIQVYPLISSYTNSKKLGELVISKTKFDQYFKSGRILRDDDKPYEAIRNVIAGVMKKDNTDDIPPGLFTFMTYGCYTDILPLKKITTNILDDFQSFVKTLDFETDGIVVKLADEKYGKLLGATSHHPRNAIAYKHANVGKQAVCTSLDLQSGKRKLTPVAYYEPTEINGALCKKATLHNWKNVIDRDIQVGDTLLIERAGGIIPKVVGSIPNKNNSKRLPLVPTVCPGCGGPIKYDEPELYCTNKKCTDIIVQQLVYSVKALGIKNSSEATITQLYDEFNVKTIIDLYELKQDELEKLNGWGERSAEKFIEELKWIKDSTIPDYKIFASLCIEGFGQSTFKRMFLNYEPSELLELDVEILTSIESIGEISAKRFYDYVRSNSQYIDRLLNFFNIGLSKSLPTTRQNSIQSICFSGRFSKKKSYYEEIAIGNNLEIAKSVTKNLNILVVADGSQNKPSNKMKKAEKYGIRIITIDEFLDEYKSSKKEFEKTS
jgi:DNA ligase (NAD+)